MSHRRRARVLWAGPHPRRRLQMDLRGVRCPLSWAKAKVCLEALTRGDELVLFFDDPTGIRDVPRAAEAEGYAVAEAVWAGDAWRVAIVV